MSAYHRCATAHNFTDFSQNIEICIFNWKFISFLSIFTHFMHMCRFFLSNFLCKIVPTKIVSAQKKSTFRMSAVGFNCSLGVPGAPHSCPSSPTSTQRQPWLDQLATAEFDILPWKTLYMPHRTNRYTRLENLARSHSVFWQFIFCRKCRFVKPLLLSSIDTFCSFTFKKNRVYYLSNTPCPLNFLSLVLSLLLLKHYFICKMAITKAS